jgi:hypothetical protein
MVSVVNNADFERRYQMTACDSICNHHISTNMMAEYLQSWYQRLDVTQGAGGILLFVQSQSSFPPASTSFDDSPLLTKESLTLFSSTLARNQPRLR